MKGVPKQKKITQIETRTKLGIDQNVKVIWKDPQNHKKFFDWLGNHLGLKSLEDWYSVHISDVVNNGGWTLIKHYHKASLFHALKAIYPEYPWNPLKFHKVPIGIWSDPANQRLFLDELGTVEPISIFSFLKATKLGIKSPEDWYDVKVEDVAKYKALSIVNRYYKGSLSTAISSLYPEYNWEMWRFHSVPRKFWADMKNVRQYIHWLERQLGITSLDDWLSVSYDMIPKKTALLDGKSLPHLLAKVYPEYPWFQKQPPKAVAPVSKAQNYLTHIIKQIFPNEEIIVNYRPSPTQKELDKLEYDIFLPQLSLALEYQGPHHYGWHYLVGTTAVQQERDQRKRRQSADRNITLIEIPFWWDRSLKSVLATLNKHRPDLVPEAPKGAVPIEHALPMQYIKRLSKLKYSIYQPSPKVLDPLGLQSAPAVDGLRFLFDGAKHITSTSGVPVDFIVGDNSVSDQLLNLLPRFPVEGVISNISDIRDVGHKKEIYLSPGHSLDLYILDLPSMINQPNEERLNYLTKHVQPISANIADTPISIQVVDHDKIVSKEQFLTQAAHWDDFNWGASLKSQSGTYLEPQGNIKWTNHKELLAMVWKHSHGAMQCQLPNGKIISVRTNLGIPDQESHYPLKSIVQVKYTGFNSNNEPTNVHISGKGWNLEDWLTLSNYINYPYSVSVGGSRSFPACKACKRPMQGNNAMIVQSNTLPDPDELRITVKGTYTALDKIPYPTKYYVCLDWSCLRKAINKYSNAHPTTRFPVFDMKIGVPNNLKLKFQQSAMFTPDTKPPQPGVLTTTSAEWLESNGIHFNKQENVLWMES